MEYENEYSFGLEREITPGSMLSVRYSDRRLGRIVEDIGSQSPEGSLIDEFYNGGIANVSASTDISSTKTRRSIRLHSGRPRTAPIPQET